MNAYVKIQTDEFLEYIELLEKKLFKSNRTIRNLEFEIQTMKNKYKQLPWYTYIIQLFNPFTKENQDYFYTENLLAHEKELRQQLKEFLSLFTLNKNIYIDVKTYKGIKE